MLSDHFVRLQALCEVPESFDWFMRSFPRCCRMGGEEHESAPVTDVKSSQQKSRYWSALRLHEG